jgi:hypothetical protein
LSNTQERLEEPQPDDSQGDGRNLVLYGEVIDGLSEQRMRAVIRALGLLLDGEIRAQVVESGQVRDVDEPFTADDAAALGWTMGEWQRHQAAFYNPMWLRKQKERGQ